MLKNSTMLLKNVFLSFFNITNRLSCNHLYSYMSTSLISNFVRIGMKL